MKVDVSQEIRFVGFLEQVEARYRASAPVQIEETIENDLRLGRIIAEGVLKNRQKNVKSSQAANYGRR